MNRSIFVLVLLDVLLSCSIARAEERPQNKELPDCDQVKILRLEGSTVEDANGRMYFKREERPTAGDSYFVEYGGGFWTRLHGTKTIHGREAERVAALWRALAPKPSPPGVFRGLHKCHVPGFAFRFYSGGKLLAESTVCWECENFGIRVGEKFAARGFDPEAQPAKDLLAKGRELFPNVKTQFDK